MSAASAPAGHGPLHGVRVLEFQGSGPGPFAGMLMADMGADVILIDRPGDSALGKYGPRRYETMMRGKRSIAADLKDPPAAACLLELVGRCDVLIDVFRPGVLERRGLGPQECLARNPKLVYARMTGWGQDGPRASQAGHDINYVALSGLLGAIGPADGPPVVPLNLVADMGGGGMLLAFGVACALLEARSSGRGQVIDASMLEGASLLGTLFSGMLAQGRWRDERGANHLDGSAPWYGTYRTRDGLYMAVGANEEPFYAALLQGLKLEGQGLPPREDRAQWPLLRERMSQAFARKTRDEWCAVFDTVDACVSPVLSLAEAREDSQARARGSFVEVAGIAQPAPAPRFSRTLPGVRRGPPSRGEGGGEALRDWGFAAEEIARLAANGLRFEKGDV